LEEKEFMKGIDMIMKEYPNVTFKTVGSLMPKYKMKWGNRYICEYGDTDIYKWVKNKFPKLIDDADIMVVPLNVNKYTRCKSSIKFLEASSAKKPGVWQDIKQYQEVVEHGVNGFLATNAKGWYDSLKKLIDDKELRRKMGEEAYRTVDEGWTVQEHIKERADFFKRVLTKQ